MNDKPKAKNLGGRPRLPAHERLSKSLHLRLTEAQHAALCARADVAGVPLVAYCRAALVGTKLRGRGDRAAAYQLQRIGTNLNQLTRLAHRDYRLALEADLRATAKAVRAAIEDLR